jgi:hypothetical protein
MSSLLEVHRGDYEQAADGEGMDFDAKEKIHALSKYFHKTTA